VTSTANVVLPPWLQAELEQILASLPPLTTSEADRAPLARWETWLGHPPRGALPPLRLLLIWDNLSGHLSYDLVDWLFAHGILPLYTPLSGSWLNLAEAWQRIVGRRALAGQHPQTPQQIITWLEETAAAWNDAPTPFEWGGKRQERRRRARQRRLGGAAALLPHYQSIAT
jgi:hypothetical protein